MHGPNKPVCKIDDDRLHPGLNRTQPGTFYTGNDSRDWERYNKERYDADGKYIHGVEMHEKPDNIVIIPPEKHYQSELINGEWWWVNACQACNGRSRRFAMRECIEHDICSICSTPRSEQKSHVMGGGEDGWICVPCYNKAEDERKAEARRRVKSDDDIDHKGTSEVVCPYCGYEYSDSWELINSDGEEVECPDCDNLFNLSVDQIVEYTTSKMACEGDCTDFTEPCRSDVDQKLCDEWNKEKFLNRTDWTPYSTWRKTCTRCDEDYRIEVGYQEPCPEDFA